MSHALSIIDKNFPIHNGILLQMSIKPTVIINLEKMAGYINKIIPILALLGAYLGQKISPYFHIITAIFTLLALLNIYYFYIQKKHTLLANFGIIAQGRYLLESIGPELRQYLFSSDTEERPFNRVERSEIYRKSKGANDSAAFGSQLNFDDTEFKLLHSMYPIDKSEIDPFRIEFGKERNLKNSYAIKTPIMISAMSFGALGKNAVRALARGAKKAGIPICTGEGGYPKYHLMEGCDLIFQMGTAKFGTRDKDGTLDDAKLQALSALPQIKMIEIKLSQGAKPGKGGLLPKEKITKEIAELRNVPMDQDIVSPPYHSECKDAPSTVAFIKKIQTLSNLPVGIKLCIGRKSEFEALLSAMKKAKTYPDYIAIDGAEGGTGAATKSFLDDVGTPLFPALEFVESALKKAKIRDKLKLICAGKLISPGKQFAAMSLGADACYSARGFLLALGCIQALQCNKNTCPVGITTHSPHLQRGLDIEAKSNRIKNYVERLIHDYHELLAALGKTHYKDLSKDNLIIPSYSNPLHKI